MADELIEHYSIWRHRKTGETYRVVWADVINESHDSQRIMLYRPELVGPAIPRGHTRFVQDVAEFLEEFELISNLDEQEDPVLSGSMLASSTPPDPVEELANGWWFWNGQADDFGPYESERICRAALAEYVEWEFHEGHGQCDTFGEPQDPDCVCRGTTDQIHCAGANCGFCLASYDWAFPT